MTEPRRVTTELLREWPLPEPGSDKEARGVVLVVGGNRGTPGAVILSGEASLRVGGGKLQVATAEHNAAQVARALPEALVAGLGEDGNGDIASSAADEVVSLGRAAAVSLLGPGLLDPDTAAQLLAEVVPQLEGPVVVDALGSAYVTHHPDGLHHLDGRAVMTVNPTELARTLGVEDEQVDDDPVAATVRLAERARALVLCGGTRKIIATPDGRTWQVLEGGPGLGVAGSGDVQAGYVSGLVARGADPAQAAVWGAYLHASSGDRLAERIGPVGFLARELAGEAPRLLAELAG
ncbi:MAG: NAD(P)H-hydrate dehydratase [Nocardioides sp.]